MPQLSRDFDERKALVRGLINALIRNESIETTEAKADAIVDSVEKLVSKAKDDDLHNRRLIHAFLDDEDNTDKLVKEIAPSLAGRKGGYVRVTKIGRRKGDNAMIVRVEFSDKVKKQPKPQVKTEAVAPEKSDVKQKAAPVKRVTRAKGKKA